MAYLIHLDADAFFASVEQAADRRLRQKAVAVGGGQRGVIASASYEARAFGIHSAMPTWKAKQLCPELIVVPGHFDLYEQFSDTLFDLCRDRTPYVEQSSIDEGYLDFRGSEKSTAAITQLARRLEEEVSSWLKITTSQGLAKNKVVSQIASKLRKPQGFVLVPEGREAAFLSPLDPGRLPGIGPRARERLYALGLRSIRDLVQAGPSVLSHLFGSRGPTLYSMAQGQDDRPVELEKEKPRSFGEQETFDEDIGSAAKANQCLQQMLDRQLVRLRKTHQGARVLTVTIRYTDHEEQSARISLPEPASIAPTFAPHLPVLLNRAWSRRVCLRCLRLQLSRLYPEMQQTDLFDPQNTRWQKLSSAVDGLNAQLGANILFRASTRTEDEGKDA